MQTEVTKKYKPKGYIKIYLKTPFKTESTLKIRWASHK